jgi:predicted nicotinamide N-methyase
MRREPPRRHQPIEGTGFMRVGGLSKLNRNIRKTLPEAEVVKTVLPGRPSIALYLISPHNMARSFTPEETRSIFSHAPYWAFCWSSGQALAQYVFRNAPAFMGKSVLDFGSGSGVGAIAAAMAKARTVIACDCDEDALVAVQANARLNGQAVFTCRAIEESPHRPDLILASDILYDPENHSLPDRFLEWSSEVILADSRVPAIPSTHYVKVAEFRATTVPDLGESEITNDVRIYRAGRSLRSKQEGDP